MDPSVAEVLRPAANRKASWSPCTDSSAKTRSQDYFDAYTEEHALHYTELHKAFASTFEGEIQGWLADEGLGEEHLEAMLQLGREGGDPDVEAMIDIMLEVMHYYNWIQHVFELKRRVQERKILRAKR